MPKHKRLEDELRSVWAEWSAPPEYGLWHEHKEGIVEKAAENLGLGSNTEPELSSPANFEGGGGATEHATPPATPQRAHLSPEDNKRKSQRLATVVKQKGYGKRLTQMVQSASLTPNLVRKQVQSAKDASAARARNAPPPSEISEKLGLSPQKKLAIAQAAVAAVEKRKGESINEVSGGENHHELVQMRADGWKRIVESKTYQTKQKPEGYEVFRYHKDGENDVFFYYDGRNALRVLRGAPLQKYISSA
jgi:hypothetical protein